MAKKQKTKKNAVKDWGRALGFALILVLLVKGFAFESYMVDTTRMEQTIMTGDYLLVNKLTYGARLPVTLLSVPFFPQVYNEWIQLPAIRIPGFGTVNANDILVFNYPGQMDPPLDKKEIMAKRLVALPGDTLRVYDKQVFVNKVSLPNPPALQNNYRLVTDGSLLDDDFLKKYQITEGGMVSDMGIYDFALTESMAEALKSEPKIRYIRKLKDFPGEQVRFVFPIGHYYVFNKDYFGPVVIPYKGQQVYLDFKTAELYKEIIEDYEGNSLEVKNSKVYVNGQETTHYTIKQNYYFVMDDNRDNAKDSRYWGFLPQSYLIGKANRVLFSFDKSEGKIRWSRMFKAL